ncbi:hypothetical protein MSAN_01168900 [Mycena sanguinolenta]|uniref:N-acetyltransferase domain-containing protein n=1 Tax=Mycena sanguinolenta TaxID=230812 RepID=A0A8H7D6P0_9AGAR|nr:hypothetical protein MSAN_01168900 [Mycena sanguinolenta]
MTDQRPYVREARRSDFEEISAFEARAFADDPEMNWFAGLTAAIADESPTQSAQSLENLRKFLDSVNRSVALVDGRVTVLAIPQESGSEKLVAFASWVPPHKVIEGTMTSIRSKAFRSLFTWGFTLWWRATVIFKPTIGAIVKKAIKSRGYQETDHYRLEITATDPEYQGKGYSTMLMKEGFEYCGPKPITLEATTAHSRDIYAHQGFEIVESLTLGQGKVNSRGLNTQDKGLATGFPVWIMIKWPART